MWTLSYIFFSLLVSGIMATLGIFLFFDNKVPVILRAYTAHENDVQATLTAWGIFVKQTAIILVCTFLHAINDASSKRHAFPYFIFVSNRTRD